MDTVVRRYFCRNVGERELRVDFATLPGWRAATPAITPSEPAQDDEGNRLIAALFRVEILCIQSSQLCDSGGIRQQPAERREVRLAVRGNVSMSSGGLLSPLFNSGDPRSIQPALKLRF